MARARPLTSHPLIVVRALAGGLLALAARPVTAQPLTGAPRSEASLRPSVAVTVVVATHALALASVGLEHDAGLYTRFGLVASAGTSTANATANGTRAVGEVAAIGRFLLDPLRQSTRGVYATGGLALRLEQTARPRPLILAGLGVEGRPLGHIVPAVEAGFGGGARFSVVLRPTRANRR